MMREATVRLKPCTRGTPTTVLNVHIGERKGTEQKAHMSPLKDLELLPVGHNSGISNLPQNKSLIS